MFSSSTFTVATTPADFAATAGGAAAGKKQRKEEPQTCLPVTIRAIDRAVEQRAESGEIHFYGAEPGVLLLVALVESLTTYPTSVELSLNDGTSRIKARQYLSSQSGAALSSLAAGQYVTVFGSVRTAPEVHFAVAGMSPVESADEVSYHMIEAAHAALKLQKTTADPVTPAPKKSLKAESDLSPQKMEVQTEAPATAMATEQPLSGSALKKAVLRVIEKEGQGHPEGVSLAMICSHISSTPSADVTVALQKLVDAADIYTTIDDEHFLLLEE